MPREKDITEKLLEDHNDVFADIVNQLLFDGRELIREDELEAAAPVSQLKFASGLHEQERDVVKYWKKEHVTIAVIGLENQSSVHPLMPMRNFSYDGAVYKEQVNRYQEELRGRLPHAPVYPCITLVLYFGTTPWKGPRTLRECFPELPPELAQFLPDYRVWVVEVAFLAPEQLQRLKSDFRFIADYLVQTRQTGRYEPSDAEIRHVDETLKLMSAVTGDSSFEAAINTLLLQDGKETVTMCEVVQNFRNEGYEKGRREGIQETRRQYEAVLAEKDRINAEMGRINAEMGRINAEKDRRIRELELALKNARGEPVS